MEGATEVAVKSLGWSRDRRFLLVGYRIRRSFAGLPGFVANGLPCPDHLVKGLKRGTKSRIPEEGVVVCWKIADKSMCWAQSLGMGPLPTALEELPGEAAPSHGKKGPCWLVSCSNGQVMELGPPLEAGPPGRRLLYSLDTAVLPEAHVWSIPPGAGKPRADTPGAEASRRCMDCRQRHRSAFHCRHLLRHTSPAERVPEEGNAVYALRGKHEGTVARVGAGAAPLLFIYAGEFLCRLEPNGSGSPQLLEAPQGVPNSTAELFLVDGGRLLITGCRCGIKIFDSSSLACLLEMGSNVHKIFERGAMLSTFCVGSLPPAMAPGNDQDPSVESQGAAGPRGGKCETEEESADGGSLERRLLSPSLKHLVVSSVPLRASYGARAGKLHYWELSSQLVALAREQVASEEEEEPTDQEGQRAENAPPGSSAVSENGAEHGGVAADGAAMEEDHDIEDEALLLEEPRAACQVEPEMRFAEAPESNFVQLLWHPHRPLLVAVAEEHGDAYVIEPSLTSNWPGAMYPPGYQVLNDNMPYLESETEVDCVPRGADVEQPAAAKPGGTGSSSGDADQDAEDNPPIDILSPESLEPSLVASTLFHMRGQPHDWLAKETAHDSTVMPVVPIIQYPDVEEPNEEQPQEKRLDNIEHVTGVQALDELLPCPPPSESAIKRPISRRAVDSATASGGRGQKRHHDAMSHSAGGRS
eukprot:CAMPEP_0118962062 /NCGR_PEP_ID=MMETSP1173-20130426/533_1 /TAXON_ID=1034831 /ORGANISM="Rhizochromulina marina cf, Strain CCMP1243" /LENGTH=698 /DNA_ID=CAMNT_0006910281 /DNA_START=1 /DNA_END=2094 /DNA_ORIENTATION=-